MSNCMLDFRRIPRLFSLVANMLVLVIFIGNAFGSVYSPLALQASIPIDAPPVFLQTGTAGSSTIYANNTSAKIKATAPAPFPMYYPNSYSIVSGDWWNSNYGYRKRIAVNSNDVSALSAGYSALLTLDTASLVAAGKMISTGNDLRIAYWNSSSSLWKELDRDIENMNTASTKVWFKTQTSIAASSYDANYFLYYGYSGAGNPPANRENVYVFWDDFESGALSKWSIQSGTWNVATDQKLAGTFSLKTTTGNNGWIKPSSSVSEKDVLLEAYWRSAASDLDFGQCLRVQSEATKNWFDTWVEADLGSGWNIGKFENDAWSEIIPNQGSYSANIWYKVTFIVSGETQARVLINNTQVTPPSGWANIGTTFTAPGTIAFCSWAVGSGAWVDNVKLRKYIDPEPSTSLGIEEQRYFVSGAVPESVQNADSNYFVVRSAGSTISTTAYYPSSYNLLGSTGLVSGATGDLVSNNAVYMQFRSYEINSTSKTDAFVAYRDSTTSLSTPKGRAWTGDTATWNSQSELPTSGSTIRFSRVAYSPIQSRSYEKIVATLSNDGYFDAYVWNGTSWTVTNNIASCGTSANAYKCFDLAYEKTTGRALLVYSRGTTTNETGYRIWTYGSGWSGEQLLDLPYTTGIVRWIAMAQCPGTRPGTGDDNEIALIYMDANTDVHGYVWTGSSWSLMGATAVWDDTAAGATEECTAVDYEQQSGRAMFIWGDSVATDNYNRIWNGSTLSGSTLGPDITTQGAITNWVTLKSNPASNELLYLVVDGASDLNTAYWSGSTWTIHAEHDGTVDTNAQRCADFAWEPTGNKGLLVWGTSAGAIAYKAFTAPNTWSSQQNPSMGSSTHPWVQLRTNPRSIGGDTKILGAILEGVNFDIGAISWDGSAFTVIGSNTISADTTVVTYECFEVEFENFAPKKFVSEVELTGTSNTEPWDHLVWAVDSAWTTGVVSVTVQLYNYTGAGEYPASGNGFKSYTSNSTANVDKTITQTIIKNPTQFRNATGYWKMKVTGTKTTRTQFDFKADWVKFEPSYYSEYTVSTEFLFSSMTTNTPSQLNFTVVSEYDIVGISVTIQVWNYSSSAYVTSGEGCLTYTSSGSNETKLLSINTNPQFYSSSGNARTKITGIKATNSQYQQKTNQVKLAYIYNASPTYNYLLRMNENHGTNWKVRLRAYDQSNIGRLNNCSIYIYDGSNSTQVAILNGAYTQQTGPWYDLTASDVEYIWMCVEASSAGTSYVYVYLEILVPNTTTYAQYTLTFAIT